VGRKERNVVTGCTVHTLVCLLQSVQQVLPLTGIMAFINQSSLGIHRGNQVTEVLVENGCYTSAFGIITSPEVTQ